MARSAEEVLIPTRFLVLVGHWVALLTLVLDGDRISVGINEHAGGETVTKSNQATIYGMGFLGLILGSIEILSLIVGYTMFMRVWGSIQSLVHSVALITVWIFIDTAWNARTLVWIVGLGSIIPCGVEAILVTMAARFKFKRW